MHKPTMHRWSAPRRRLRPTRRVHQRLPHRAQLATQKIYEPRDNESYYLQNDPDALVSPAGRGLILYGAAPGDVGLSPYPEKVVWRPVAETKGHVDSFYFLAVDEPKGAMHLVVTRDGNTLTIEKAENVEKLAILLNDGVADLDKPVIVRKGDAELHAGRVERRLRILVTTFEKRADARLTFSARIEVEP